MGYTQGLTLTHNKQYNSNNNSNSKSYPELVISSSSEREDSYQAALKLVACIDEELTRGIRHYRNKAGLFLFTLDEVIHAILNNNLLLPEEQKEVESYWTAPQELAA